MKVLHFFTFLVGDTVKYRSRRSFVCWACHQLCVKHDGRVHAHYTVSRVLTEIRDIRSSLARKFIFRARYCKTSGVRKSPLAYSCYPARAGGKCQDHAVRSCRTAFAGLLVSPLHGRAPWSQACPLHTHTAPHLGHGASIRNNNQRSPKASSPPLGITARCIVSYCILRRDIISRNPQRARSFYMCTKLHRVYEVALHVKWRVACT